MKAALYNESAALSRARYADYLELTKPRIAVLVLFTVAVGVLLASRGTPDPFVLLNAVVGTALVASGASALNQLLERHTDAAMQRTENRPLPAGRLQPVEVLLFGVLLAVAGLAYLWATLHQPLTVGVAAFTFASYVFVYTPLKRRSTLNTLVGAIPGALPPVIGWTAVRGSFDVEVLTVFFIVFLWQVPHFLAIAWIYREDYERAGLLMLPVVDPDGIQTGRQMVSYCLALIPASLMPITLGLASPLYLTGAVLLGGAFLYTALEFMHGHSLAQARRVLRASLIYLPALLALLLISCNWL